MHNYAEIAAEDLVDESADNVADFVIASLQHILDHEQVNASVYQGLEAIITALQTANVSPES